MHRMVRIWRWTVPGASCRTGNWKFIEPTNSIERTSSWQPNNYAASYCILSKSARNFSLSWIKLIQSTPCSPVFCKIHFNIILHLRLGFRSVIISFPHQNHARTSSLTHPCHMHRPSLPPPPPFDHSNNIWSGEEIMQLQTTHFFGPIVTCFLFGPNIFLSTLFSNTSADSSGMWNWRNMAFVHFKYYMVIARQPSP